MRLSIFVFLALLPSLSFFGQSDLNLNPDKKSKKGELFFYWGYNRAAYDKSDIHFVGDGYSFELSGVQAKDVPETFKADVYFNPKKISIPQFNIRMGYSFTDKWTFTFGYDHLKYKIFQNQVVSIEGYIDSSVSVNYAGQYSAGSSIAINEDFIKFEHTNGLNFVRFGLEYRADVWASENGKHEVNFYPGVSAGAVIPWTDFTFMNNRNKNHLHLSGFGVSASMALRYELKRRFFVQVQVHNGFIHLPHILLEEERESRGRQSISFMERSFALGVYLHKFRR